MKSILAVLVKAARGRAAHMHDANARLLMISSTSRAYLGYISQVYISDMYLGYISRVYLGALERSAPLRIVQLGLTGD